MLLLPWLEPHHGDGRSPWHASTGLDGRRNDQLVFDDDVLDYLAEQQVVRVEEVNHRAAALKQCLEKLPGHQRELVAQRYAPGGSVQEIASAAGKKVGAISQSLYRIREALLNCVERTMAGGTVS